MKRKLKPLPEITDPLALEILGLVIESKKSWALLEVDAQLGTDTARMWFYRPVFNPKIMSVQRLLAVLGYRLVLARTDSRIKSLAEVKNSKSP